MMKTTLLLVGHGSRDPEGNQEIEEFARRWRGMRPEWMIELCFIEFAEVLMEEGLARAAQQSARVIVVPLILNAAGHVNEEIPEAVEAAREKHPATEFILTAHLGACEPVLDILQRNLRQGMRELDFPDPRNTGLILLGRGSSDAGANGELAKMARWLFEDGDHELVDLAFTSVTWPRLETVVQRQARLGMTQICIVPVYLFSGVLMDRIKAQVERLQRQYPHIVFALGTHFGFDKGIFELLDSKVGGHELPEGALLECDGCKYRLAAEAEHLHDHSHTHVHHAHEHHHAHAHENAHA